MRLGVLDIGSNSAHLLVVDAEPGTPPLPVLRHKTPTRLAQCVDKDGTLKPRGVDRVVRAVSTALDAARAQRVSELIPFATAAIRDAPNRDDVLAAIENTAGVRVGYLSGEEEARLTFFAAHRWYGWSRAPLLLLDIGGGSMEIVSGRDEDPEFVVSLPLGAGRLTRSHLPRHPARERDVKALRRHVRDVLAAPAERLGADPATVLAVATSKTFAQLARLAGDDRVLRRGAVKRWIPKLAHMSPGDRADLSGVSAGRARQILAGAVVAEAAMRELGIDRVEVCPWALREGILLRRLSPLLTPDSLHQIKLIQAAADGDVVTLDEHRARRDRAAAGE